MITVGEKLKDLASKIHKEAKNKGQAKEEWATTLRECLHAMKLCNGGLETDLCDPGGYERKAIERDDIFKSAADRRFANDYHKYAGRC